MNTNNLTTDSYFDPENPEDAIKIAEAKQYKNSLLRKVSDLLIGAGVGDIRCYDIKQEELNEQYENGEISEEEFRKSTDNLLDLRNTLRAGECGNSFIAQWQNK